MHKLEGLLNTAECWSTFLVERLATMTDEAAAGQDAAAATAAGSKRKAGKQGGGARKKGKGLAAATGALDADAKVGMPARSTRDLLMPGFPVGDASANGLPVDFCQRPCDTEQAQVRDG